MKSNNSWRIRLAQVLLGAAFLLALVVVRGTHAGNEPIHMTTDWSHRHVIFSAPKSTWQHIQLLSNPRYVQQLVRRNKGNQGDPGAWRWYRAPEGPTQDTLHGDWNAYLGINGATGGIAGAAVYPAKYSFSATTATCNDFVVYNTSFAGSITAIAARAMGTFTAEPNVGDTITITNPGTGDSLIMTATAGANSHTSIVGNVSSGTFQRNATVATNATNLAAALNIANNGTFVGLTNTSAAAGAVVTITDATAGVAGNAITTAESATGFTWAFANLVDGATGAPSIVAYSNLYSGTCSGNVPSVYWAYDTATTGSIVTSPVLSGDGKQVAFVQNTAATATLVILRWAANNGTLAAPVAPTVETPANYFNGGAGCTAPCMTTLTFSGANSLDTNSSPFYDYAAGHDALYVGSNNGHLHKFTGVFNGTPTEAGGGFPATLTAGNTLTSPVYDEGASADGKVFVADSGGTLYAVDAVTGGVTAAARAAHGPGFVDSPILDPVNNTVYVFAATTGGGCGAPPAAFEYPAGAGFTAGVAPAGTANVGTTGNCPNNLYDGTFDQLYYGGAAGHMYVCGEAAGSVTPTLYQVGLNANGTFSGTVTTGPALTSAVTTGCSGVDEFFNANNTSGGAHPAGTDLIYVSVPASGKTIAPISCPVGNVGCIMSFDVTTGAAIGAGTTAVARAGVTSGASGIVVDNDASGGGSQVYYTPLSNVAVPCTTVGNLGIGGCAIQASQSGLN